MPKLNSGKPLPKHKPYEDMTLDDVRALVHETRERGLQIQSHYKRLEQEYADWEDQILEVEKIIQQLQDDTGVTKEEIYEKPKSSLDSILEEIGI